MMMMMVRRFAGVWALRDSNSRTRPCRTSRPQQPRYQTRGPRVTQTIIILLLHIIIVCHIRDTSRPTFMGFVYAVYITRKNNTYIIVSVERMQVHTHLRTTICTWRISMAQHYGDDNKILRFGKRWMSRHCLFRPTWIRSVPARRREVSSRRTSVTIMIIYDIPLYR